jgi:hypothetical protein
MLTSTLPFVYNSPHQDDLLLGIVADTLRPMVAMQSLTSSVGMFEYG